jgi:hypothetical protein
VVKGASFLRVGVTGVALGSIQEAQDAQGELSGSSTPAVVLVSSFMDGGVGARSPGHRKNATHGPR